MRKIKELILKVFKNIKLWFKKLFKKESKCYYIHSNNLLPPPLDEENETKCLEGVAKGDLEARNTLIIHNLRLVVFIAKKFESTKINLEDLVSIGSIGLIKAIQTFKMDKNIKLATYASRCIENEILMFLRKTNRTRQELSLDEVLNVDSEGNEMVLSDILGSEDEIALTQLTEEEKRQDLKKALASLNDEERSIIIMRFGLYGHEELTQKEVADKLGISQSYISRLEKRIIEKMRNSINLKISA